MKTKPKSRRGRPIVKHGGYSLLTTGELPENRKYLRPYLSGIREALIRDLGPREEDLTAAQLILVDRVVTTLGILRLVEEFIREKGIFANPQGFLNPALSKHYIAYSNSIRLNLQALGIARKDLAGEELSLEGYIRQADAGKDTDQPEIVDPGASQSVVSGSLPDSPITEQGGLSNDKGQVKIEAPAPRERILGANGKGSET